MIGRPSSRTAAEERERAAGRIMVALDYPDEVRARELLRRLDGAPCWMKVGMELFYAAGPQFVRELKAAGYRVFIDLKLHDIPNTVRGGAASLTRLGADLFNVHAAGGLAMMEAAMAGVEEALGRPAPGPASAAEAAAGGAGTVPSRPLVIAVTQLTSTSRAVLNEEIGLPGSVEEAVLRYARLAQRAGLDGVVASPLEVGGVKAACGSGFLTVTPGIRPAGAALGDQSRVTTPAEAVGMGTDYIVVGRPITGAADPRAALESIIDEIVGTRS